MWKKEIVRAMKPRIFVCAAIGFGLLFSAVSSGEGTAQADLTTPRASYTICGLKGDVVSFSAPTLEKRLSLSTGHLSGIIVIALPSASDGTLKVDGTDVQLYETISRDGLNRLTFVPGKNSSSAEFRFVPLVGQKTEPCSRMTIALLDKANTAPAVKSAAAATYADLTVSGCLSVRDEDEDTVKLVVTKEPQKGKVTLSGFNYTYVPYAGATGTDRFSYKAVDRYGYASGAATVTVSVQKNTSAFSYADMQGDPGEYAALRLAQQGVVTGEQMGGKYFFEPDRTVTQADFLVMLLSVTGRTGDLSTTVNTGCSNDTSIPLWLKSYVACAKRLGILSGRVSGGSFEAQNPVTMTQAVYMIDNSVHIANAEESGDVFRDESSLPSWAAQSFLNLYSAGVLTPDNGYARPAQTLTRSRAAQMLYALSRYCAAHKDATSWN